MLANCFVNTLRIADDVSEVRAMYEPHINLVRIRNTFVYVLFTDYSSAVIFEGNSNEGIGIIISDDETAELFPLDSIYSLGIARSKSRYDAISLIDELLAEAKEVQRTGT